MKLLVILIIILVAVAISQLLRVYRLSTLISDTKEEDLDVDSNNRIANYLMIFGLLLVASFFYLIYSFSGNFLPVAATEHGVDIDLLMKYNLYLVSIIFVVFNLLLFSFARKYRYKYGVKAFHYSHSNKLEAIWTVIPALVMGIIIVAGLFIWNKINDEPTEDVLKIQLYAKQFDWTARYPGEDNVLGPSSFNFISGPNPLGLITKDVYANQLEEIETTLKQMEDDLAHKIMGHTEEEELLARKDRLNKTKVRLLGFSKDNPAYDNTNDDIVVKEMVLPVNRQVELLINSRDVIHSVWIPHFRLQMNAVPGMTTNFKFTPTVTNKEMQQNLDDPDFTYVVMCNKICGASHYKMRMEINVVSEEEYEKWLAAGKTFKSTQDALSTASL